VTLKRRIPTLWRRALVALLLGILLGVPALSPASAKDKKKKDKEAAAQVDPAAEAAALAEKYPLLPSDGKPWEFPAPTALFVIPDVHGDYDALVSILAGAGLIDENLDLVKQVRLPDGTVTADFVIVDNGDRNGKGNRTRLVMDLFIRLKRQAAGRLKLTAGNFDVGLYDEDVPRIGKGEHKDFADDYEDTDLVKELVEKGGLTKAQALVRAGMSDGEYAELNADVYGVLKFGKVIVTHGAVLLSIAKLDIGAFNATLRAHILWRQGRAPKPPKPTRWVIRSEDSPIHNHSLARGKEPESEVRKANGLLGAVVQILGHSPTVSRLIEFVYGGAVVLGDTGASKKAARNGKLSLIFADKDGNITPMNDIPRLPREQLAAYRAREIQMRGLCKTAGEAAGVL
jgi:hypothetical protein